MKKIILFILILTNSSVFTQSQIESKVNDVKVFKKNAQITRNISVTSIPGTQEIILTGISTQVIPSSLQVNFSNSNSILLSAKYQNTPLPSTPKNKDVAELQKKLEDLNDELRLIGYQRESLFGAQKILEENQELGSESSGFTPEQVIQLSNQYYTRSLEIKTALGVIDKKQLSIPKERRKIEKQLNEMKTKVQNPNGNIILKISSVATKPVNIECKYIVNNVGWYSTYDIRSEGITEGVQLNYKANVYQNTGVNWENVSVSVSTGNPSQDNNRPLLRPLYASTSQYKTQNRPNRLQKANLGVQMRGNMARSEVIEDEKEPQKPTTVAENQLSIEFDILNKQTINSNGEENLIALKSYDLETKYIYHSVPKLNKGAFLLARISNWSQYNLLAGEANIFFEGGFVGTSQINPEVTSKELLISMGLDNNIVIQRRPRKFTSSKIIGTNTKESIGYDFIIKNKKSVPIKIEILDQIPVSTDKAIQVTLEEQGNAEYTKEIGKLLWTLDIGPRQTAKENFIYTVKYPKKKFVSGIK